MASASLFAAVAPHSKLKVPLFDLADILRSRERAIFEQKVTGELHSTVVAIWLVPLLMEYHAVWLIYDHGRGMSMRHVRYQERESVRCSGWQNRRRLHDLVPAALGANHASCNLLLCESLPCYGVLEDHAGRRPSEGRCVLQDRKQSCLKLEPRQGWQRIQKQDEATVVCVFVLDLLVA